MTLLYSPETEKALLCCLLNEPKTLSLCLSRGVGVYDFHFPAHIHIYLAIKSLHDSEEPIDIITVTQKLRELGYLEDCGGAAYITELSILGGIPSNAKAYIEELEAYKQKRAADNLANRIKGELENPINNLPEWLSALAVEAAGLRLSSNGLHTPVQTARAFLDFYERLETTPAMVSCGIESIDMQAGPFMRGDTVVVSGVTGGGKSALVNSFIDKSIDLNQCCAVFTLEMTSIQYVERIASARAGVDMHNVRKVIFKGQRVHDHTMAKIGEAVSQYAKSSIYIVDDCSTLSDLESKCLQIHAKRPLDLIVLDYAQLLSAPGDTREQEVANVSKGLKRLAVKLNCVAFLLSQLNDDGRLRESRAIGHDANVVLNIERDDEYTWVRVSKGRSCPSGTKIPLKWIPHYTKFENVGDNI